MSVRGGLGRAALSMRAMAAVQLPWQSNRADTTPPLMMPAGGQQGGGGRVGGGGADAELAHSSNAYCERCRQPGKHLAG